MKRVFFIGLLVFTLAACADKDEKRTLPAEVDMAKLQTQCSDNWGLAIETTEEVIRNYFKKTYDVDLIEVQIQYVETDPTCLACSCPSGNIIRVVAKREDVSVVEDEGFSLGNS